MSSLQDGTYLALMGLAEEFRTMNPPNMRNCVKCLTAIFQLNPMPVVELQVRFHLGTILTTFAGSLDQALDHLEKAFYIIVQRQVEDTSDMKFHIANSLADIYAKKDQRSRATSVLQQAVELSRNNTFWHCRFLFKLVQLYTVDKQYMTAVNLLTVGADYAQKMGVLHTRILFLLSQAMLLMLDKKLPEVHQVLNNAGPLIEAWQGTLQQKEALKIFFLVLQVCYYLSAGQVKSVKPLLKQLQQGIQTITQMPSDEEAATADQSFQWLPKEHMCVLVYLVTVLHSMQAGYMDKALKYTDKALMQIEKLKIVDANPILHSFQILLLEHLAMCRLVMGKKCHAVQEINQAVQICRLERSLAISHAPQMHCLLGLYAMSMNCMEAAEAQFNAVLRENGASSDLRIMASLNLAIVYLRSRKEQELNDLLIRLNPESIQTNSHSLRAAAYYVHGLNAFFQARYNDAKRHLRETLKMANAEDLNRLTSCSLVLLGHIFYSMGNSKESLNMVTPAMQLAGKIPDVHVQLWASALLKDLYRLCNQPGQEQEYVTTHTSFSNQLLQDHFQASQLAEHTLIQWIHGDPPVIPVAVAAAASGIP